MGHSPTIVARSLETALKVTTMMNRVPGYLREHGYTEEWTCAFVDGEGHLRCTTTIDGDKLYVEAFDLEGDWAATELEDFDSPRDDDP